VLTIKIEMWLDFTCPYCYIGKRKLDKALEEFENKDAFKVEYKSFDTTLRENLKNGEIIQPIWKEKHNLSTRQFENYINELHKEGKLNGIDFHLEGLKKTNTFHAHRLVKYAEKYDKQSEVVERLFYNYFEKQKNIEEHEVLKSLGSEIGFDNSAIEELLCMNKYDKKVKSDQIIAEELEVKAVPFLIFDDLFAMTDELSIEGFLEALSETWQRSTEKLANKNETTYCADDTC